MDPEEMEPDEIAQALRIGWAVANGPLWGLVDLIEDAGIFVVRVDFGNDSTDGVSYHPNGSLPAMIFLKSRAPGCRLRWTMAHELGHLIMHPFPTRTMEDEADEFAAELLMPHNDIITKLQPPKTLRLDALCQLKKMWGTSMVSIVRQHKNYGLVTHDQYRRAMIRMGPYRKVEPVQIEVEEPTLLREVVNHHRETLRWTDDEICRHAAVLPGTGFLECLGVGPARTDDRLRIIRDPSSA